jgi:pullulanase
MIKFWLDERHVVTVETDMPLEEKKLHLYTDGKKNSYPLFYEERVDEKNVHYRSPDMLPVEKGMTVEAGGDIFPVYLRKIVHDPAFDEEFSALDEELGAVAADGKTTFRVWSPLAESMNVVVNNKLHPMQDKRNGTWEKSFPEDLHGAEYFYKGMVHGEVKSLVDPYAKALTPNSVRGVVYRLDKNTDRPDRPPLAHTQDSIIYELHIRDATIHPDSGVKAKGKYKGLTEKGTVNKDGFSTGLSYIKDLGVTHVELLPINDFGRVDDFKPDETYNWGYDPLYFQVPEGSFATSVKDPFARIRECREMIDAFHEEEIGVIADVVFNHVFVMQESSFEKLMPGYYFRYHQDGTISNGTGVGNDIASERLMVRKFILDTVDYWLEHYRIDGFRFDLMGALDKWTMQEIAARCRDEAVPIIILGEGWHLPTALADDLKTTNTQAGDLPDLRFFNDFFRDTAKGNLFDLRDYGYINGKGRFIERLPQLVKGSADREEAVSPFTAEVVQTVNYTESHDNHTLWDRLEYTNADEPEEDRRAMCRLALGLTLVSQGVPFIHAGQEFFRTKLGEGNSYISSDRINQLDWEARGKYDSDTAFIKGIIAVRRRYEVFRLRSAKNVRDRLHILSTPAPVFGFTLLEAAGDIAIYLNPTKRIFEIQLPSPGEWHHLASSVKDTRESIIGEFMTLEPYEFLMIKKQRR